MAALVLRAGGSLDTKALRAWGKERLATYKVPQEAVVLQELPRNAMGKVSKPDLKKIVAGGQKITKSRGGSHQSPKTPKPLNKKGWQSPDCQPFQILVD